jgi:hypothetical protein
MPHSPKLASRRGPAAWHAVLPAAAARSAPASSRRLLTFSGLPAAACRRRR